MPYKDKEKQREAQRKWEKENRGAGKRHKVWMFIFYPDTAEVGWRDECDEIAARCDGLRGRVEQVVEGIRGAVGRAEMAIADLARKLGPRSARMTTRALKRDLAALERDYGEDDDRSPKARAAEAQRAARARDANRDDRPPQRSWSQSR